MTVQLATLSLRPTISETPSAAAAAGAADLVNSGWVFEPILIEMFHVDS